MGRVCSELGRRNVCLVSIHVNAAGRGDKWYNATGWSCYTSKGQTEGDKLADCLCQAAARILHDHKMRFDYSDGDPDQESNFYILKKTACASCLSENGFMDCRESLEFLLSDEGKAAIVQLHVEGIIAYVRSRSMLARVDSENGERQQTVSYSTTFQSSMQRDSVEKRTPILKSLRLSSAN